MVPMSRRQRADVRSQSCGKRRLSDGWNKSAGVYAFAPIAIKYDVMILLRYKNVL